MKRWEFAKGLHEVGQGAYAYLLPNGSWGWSNAGLVVDGDRSLLVDTLFDLHLTGGMLRRMADVAPAARTIDVLVNTHANGDHTFGNQLVGGARIVASKATADDFFHLTPEIAKDLITRWEQFGEGGRYLFETNGPHYFDFTDIVLTPPTETFEGETTLKVGDKDVVLIDVGPAHTRGDTLAYVPSERVVYTGDILFMGGHPLVWSGPISGWIAALDRILALEVDVVVPGHGPITDKAGVRDMRVYLALLIDESRVRYDAGMAVEDAAIDIVLRPPFESWDNPERIVASVDCLFREFSGRTEAPAVMEMFNMMARYVRRRREAVHVPRAGCGHEHG